MDDNTGSHDNENRTEDVAPVAGTIRSPAPESEAAVLPTGALSIGHLDAVRRLMSQTDLSLIGSFQHSVSSALARSRLLQTNWLETILPRPFELPAMRAIADASQAVLGSTSFTGLLAAQEASKRIHHAFAAEQVATIVERFGSLATAESFRAQILELTRAADTFSSIAATIATAASPLLVERALAVGSRGWDEATRLLIPLDDDLSSLDAVTGLGRGAAGIGASGLLLTDIDSDLEIDVVEWGPAPMHATLRELLAGLDPALPAKLDGAWERVSRPGPDAAAQAAYSLVELVDWALRLAARDDEVLAWVHEEGRQGELHDGRPTRVLRLKYLVRNRPGEAKIARLYQRALTDLVTALQSAKHSASGKDLDAVMSLAPTVEGLLFFALRR